MTQTYHVFTDASFVLPLKKQEPIYGIGIVVLKSDFSIEKMLSIPLRTIGQLRTDSPTTHEFHAACLGLKSVPKKSNVHIYVDNKSVRDAIKGKYSPKGGALYYRDFEIATQKIQEAHDRHNNVEAIYIHNTDIETIFLANAIAHNASAVVTGARKRQKTTPLLKDGPFASNSNKHIKTPQSKTTSKKKRKKSRKPVFS